MKRFKTYWSNLSGRQRKTLRLLSGALAGGLVGYAYYAFVGCSSGACPITSNPLVSTVWGALIGGAIAA